MAQKLWITFVNHWWRWVDAGQGALLNYLLLDVTRPSPFHRNNTAVNSKVIAVTMRPEPRVKEAQMEIELAHLANVSSFSGLP